MAQSSPSPRVVAVSDVRSALTYGGRFDAVICVGPDTQFDGLASIDAALRPIRSVDQRLGRQPILVHASTLAGQRLVVAPTGPLTRGVDDVRRIAAAVHQGLDIAWEAGARAPLFVLHGVPEMPSFARAAEVAALAALEWAWTPLQAREAGRGDQAPPLNEVGLAAKGRTLSSDWVGAIERGRALARDLAGADPERMAPPAFADWLRAAFASTPITVEVISEPDVLGAQYPLLSAVARATRTVPRHHPRVVRLRYTGAGPITQTLLLAGKGVTYDTGGADLKVDGKMAGMRHDKAGAAAVAGFMASVALRRPKHLSVIAELGLVRNSLGAEAYVSDEIITGHAGRRVMIGNTDAEGRLVLADLLSHLREQALSAPKPSIFSVATLTGHAVLSVGQYSAVIDNGPARAAGMAARLAEAGDRVGDGAEVSRLRAEDLAFIAPRSSAYDVLSSNTKPSSETVRGHQFPAAFLAAASGLDAHDLDSAQPLAYTHIDNAGSAVSGLDWSHGRPTAAPVALLAEAFLAER